MQIFKNTSCYCTYIAYNIFQGLGNVLNSKEERKMTTLFKVVLAGIEDNNDINDASYNDWTDAQHAIETYEENFSGECDEEEMAHTIKALNIIIESNGDKLEQAVEQCNMSIWGQNFADNSGNVAFGG